MVALSNIKSHPMIYRVLFELFLWKLIIIWQINGVRETLGDSPRSGGWTV